MKFKVKSSKFENARRKRIDPARVLRTSNFELRSSRPRRASVLVLVMTLLGILFVLGIAFLASMNFEADMIVSETQRTRAESRVNAVGDLWGSMLRDGLMSDSRVPFGDPSAALSATAFGEMPGVQSSFSSVEPNRLPGPDNAWDTPDDLFVFSAYSDMVGLRRQPYAGTSLPQGFAIDTRLPNGTNIDKLPTQMFDCDLTNSICVCATGPDKGMACTLPTTCALSAPCEGPRVLDADGDGVVDSIMVDASLLDFSAAQLAALSARLNPASNPTGKVYVGLRVLPHGGLVNLNASHPKLIENVLFGDDPIAPRLYPPGQPRDPDYGNFYHRPAQLQVAYSPLLEEPTLRRRGFLSPRSMPPSSLHGDPLLKTNPTGNADMQWQLFPPVYPNGAAAGLYDSVFTDKHRYSAFQINWDPADPDGVWQSGDYQLWVFRMEPIYSDSYDFSPNDGLRPEYDRRHLVTTVSHDDLLTRGGRVPNPAAPGGEEDILAKMTQANQAADDPDICPPLRPSGYRGYPFEYPTYPQTIPDTTKPNAGNCICDCATSTCCQTNARKGRLQLSIPYLDDEIEAARDRTDPLVAQCITDGYRSPDECVNEALDRVFHLIHDAFFLLVRNAAHVTTLEGTPCTSHADCPYANGACGVNGLCTVAAGAPFTDCRVPTLSPCSIPGSVCRTTDGVCTIQAPYWQDKSCAATGDCASSEFCDIPPGMITGACKDVWTGQTHSQALISRTAAALTANFIDYADLECFGGARDTGSCTVDADCPGGACADRGIPTRIALRSFDFNRGVCTQGTKTGFVCDINGDCDVGAGGVCSPPLKSAGREFDFDPGVPTKFEYVYGLERQPYITEVATLAEPGSDPPPPGPSLVAWAIEIFNPHDSAINPADPNTQYVLIEVDPAGVQHEVALVGSLEPNPKPFSTFVTAPNAGIRDALVGPALNGNVYDLPPGDALTFGPDWTLYLIRRVVYPGDSAKVPPYTDIVVDQFEVKGDKIANPAACKSNPGDCITTLERVVTAAVPWTATVPKRYPREGSTSLGDWNLAVDGALHPVEANFANLGSFSRAFNNPIDPTDPRNRSVSFPTTGSLLMLMRHANRPLQDYTSPSGNTVEELAFTTRLIGDTIVKDPVSALTLATIPADQQIDNGRMPVFDEPVRGCVGGTNNGKECTTNVDCPGGVCGTTWYSAHHLSPSVTQLGAPGNLDMLPWGQLVFDYFTALPLSNPGPYFGPDPDKIAVPDSLPRIDLDGLRVHGRININAAPWTVLAGVPFVPLEKIPVSFKARMRRDLGFVKNTAIDPLNPTIPDEVTVLDDNAARIGSELARAMVAYRELLLIPPLPGQLTPYGSGDYAAGFAADGTTPTPFARNWQSPAPFARRGTGFMSVGELANVRHLGAETLPPPFLPGFPTSFFRIDMGVLDVDKTDNNQENFVDAAAALVALGDWVTVRSQVFTVYGILRGEEDPGIVDPDPLVQQKLRTQDADSRALRFQETIDRLPTFLGEPAPARIGDRMLARYSDVRND